MASVDLHDLEIRAARFDTAAGMRQLRIAIVALLFLGVSTCLAKGANGPTDPRLVTASSVPPFAQTALNLVPGPPPAPDPAATVPGQPAPTPTVAPTPAAQLCALLADTVLTRERNVAGRWDLAGYAAMVIDHGKASSVPFTPRAVNFASTIVFFDAKGTFLATVDVEPCPAQSGCAAVPPPAPYRYLVVAPRGQPAAWGAGPGSQLELAETCGGPRPA